MNKSSVFISTLRLLVSAAFIASGILKLYPIEFFENDLLSHHLGTELLVVFESRLLIAVEIILGVGILIGLWDRVFLSLSFLMLLVYSIYLTIIYFIEGNGGNCGCFGNAIVLSPLEGILKNVVLAGLMWPIWKKRHHWRFRFRNGLLIAVSVLGLALPFILNPIFFPKKVIMTEGEKVLLPLDSLYTNDGKPVPDIDLRKDKQVVAFFLLNCKHCRLAARRLETIKHNYPELPISFILCGKDEDVADFISESGVRDIPYTVYNSLDKIVKISGPQFPSIYLMNDAMVDAQLDFYDIQSGVMVSWFHQP